MNRRGMTFIELIVVVLSIAAIVAVLIALNPPRRPGSSRQIKDANQVRQTMLAMISWSINNKDLYPLPSAIDRNNTTVPGPGPDQDQAGHAGKDNTGNLLSILIWNGSITPELFISPAEVSPSVRVDDDYQTQNPKACTVGGGSDALWDPGFSGTAAPEEGQGDAENTPRRAKGTSNNSYAQALMLGGTARSAAWRNTFTPTEAVFGNRGPLYQGVTGNDVAPSPHPGVWTLAPGAVGTNSNTLAIHGGRNTWEGNIGYNDCHVNFETRPDPVETTYRSLTAKGVQTRSDNLFVDESDEDNRIAGSTPATAFMHNTNNWLRPIARVLATSGVDKKPVYTITRWVD